MKKEEKRKRKYSTDGVVMDSMPFVRISSNEYAKRRRENKNDEMKKLNMSFSCDFPIHF